jgi:hypothetical protein
MPAQTSLESCSTRSSRPLMNRIARSRASRQALGKAQAADKTHPAVDGPLHWLGHHSFAHTDGIVQIGLHECQHLGAIVAGKGLVGVLHEGGGPGVLAADAGGQRKRQQNRQDFCWSLQIQPVSQVYRPSPGGSNRSPRRNPLFAGARTTVPARSDGRNRVRAGFPPITRRGQCGTSRVQQIVSRAWSWIAPAYSSPSTSLCPLRPSCGGDDG